MKIRDSSMAEGSDLKNNPKTSVKSRQSVVDPPDWGTAKLSKNAALVERFHSSLTIRQSRRFLSLSSNQRLLF
jgi:hypothetical protein